MSDPLLGLAYRMLGSVSDAEDVLQEAQLRLHQQHRAGQQIISEQAFLYRAVSNLCVDKLRQLKRERKHYFGPWLPEPLLDERLDPAETRDGLSMAYLLMLETLAPAERIAFVLREVFDFSHAEVASTLEISEANARQRLHRARRKVAKANAEKKAPNSQQLEQNRQVIEAFSQFLLAGDVNNLIQLMRHDVVAYADGGGVVSAAIAPITEPARIAQVSTFLFNKLQNDNQLDSQLDSQLDWQFVQSNSGYAVLVKQDGKFHSLSQLQLDESGQITAMFTMRHPGKLAGIL